jgi:hypothetical protein
MRGSLHDLQFAVGKGMREVLKGLCSLRFAKLSPDLVSILSYVFSQLQANVIHVCSFGFAAMGVAELLSWGAPPILVLLHLCLVHHSECESDQVGCLEKQSNPPMCQQSICLKVHDFAEYFCGAAVVSASLREVGCSITSSLVCF